MQLKRFGGDLTTKITKDIKNEPFIYITEDSSMIKYELFGVIEHTGTQKSGHYFAYIKHSNDWYLVDDKVVKRVDLEEVEKAQAYILFYHK